MTKNNCLKIISRVRGFSLRAVFFSSFIQHFCCLSVRFRFENPIIGDEYFTTVSPDVLWMNSENALPIGWVIPMWMPLSHLHLHTTTDIICFGSVRNAPELSQSHQSTVIRWFVVAKIDQNKMKKKKNGKSKKKSLEIAEIKWNDQKNINNRSGPTSEQQPQLNATAANEHNQSKEKSLSHFTRLYYNIPFIMVASFIKTFE